MNQTEIFNQEFLKVAFPEWIKSTPQSHAFRGYILDKHAILENLMDLLLSAHQFGNVDSIESENYRHDNLSDISFSNKIKLSY